MAFGAMRGALEGRGIRPQVFFLEARDEVLIRRFSETRHRHPLATSAGSRARSPRNVACSIRSESESDVVIDTATSRCASSASASSPGSARPPIRTGSRSS